MNDQRSDSRRLIPEAPHDAGIRTPSPRIEDVEGAHLLDNEARSLLESRGFTDDQILRWVEAYFVQDHEGDVDGLLEFIRDHEEADGEVGP